MSNSLNEIEDIFKIHSNTPIVDNTKLTKFMTSFIEKSNKNKILSPNSIYSEIRKEFKIAPSKIQMRRNIVEFHNNKIINDTLKRYLIKRSTRSESGVLVNTVTLPPDNFSCKYNCSYCPQEMDLEGKHTQPRSYISSEPAMRRALRYNFDIRGQFWDRIRCYIDTGNIDLNDPNPQKMEVILSGGTWECYQKKDRDSFINQIYYAANTFGCKDRDMLSIEEEETINETAKYRIIGLTLETRPDFIRKSSIRDYRRYGVTRIQIGVQHFDDSVLEKVNRKCYTQDTIKAIRLLKQVGLKVVVHLMPDLPNSNPILDKNMFKRAIEDEDVQFDDIKIYPTAVTKSFSDKLILKSDILDWYNNGTYKPYAEENLQDLIDVIKYYLINIKPWVRIQRLVRDIPPQSIEVGYKKKVNLRQLIQDEIDKDKKKTYEIRTMEVRESEHLDKSTRLVVRKYKASKGIEYHLSIEAYQENILEKLYYYLFKIFTFIWSLISGKYYYYSGSKNYVALFGFLRLRIDPKPGGDIIKEINNTALIREVHVYGRCLGVGSDSNKSQHKGYGMYLMKIAEDIALSSNYKKISVISGVGTREYYRKKCNYYLDGTYMIKDLSQPFNWYRTIFYGFLFIVIFNFFF